jgi:hypothetical protein
MATLNNVTTADIYEPKATLEVTYPIRRSTVRVYNAAVFRQLLVATENDPTQAVWEEELFVAPGVQPDRRDWYFGIRVRSAVKGTPAQVTIEAVPK